MSKSFFLSKGNPKGLWSSIVLFVFGPHILSKNTLYKYIILKNINTIYFLFLLKNLNLHVSVTIQTFCDIFPYIIHQHHQGKGFPTFCKTFGSKKQKYYLAFVINISCLFLNFWEPHLGTNKLYGKPQSSFLPLPLSSLLPPVISFCNL